MPTICVLLQIVLYITNVTPWDQQGCSQQIHNNFNFNENDLGSIPGAGVNQPGGEKKLIKHPVLFNILVNFVV